MAFRPLRQSSSTEPGVNPRQRTRPAISPPSPTPTARVDDSPTVKRAHHKVDRAGLNWNEDGEYLVGKGRPPQDTRWKKGQSGNPRGPIKREPLSPRAQFEQGFLAPFNATVNGETVALTMDVFAVQSLKNAAAKGSVTAARTLLELFTTIIRQVAEQEPRPQVDAWEQDAIDRLLAELGLPERPVIRQTDRSKGQL